MATMDVFGTDAFSLVELTNAITHQEYLPGFLGSLNLFAVQPVRTTTVAIESVANTLRLVQTTPRGAPPDVRTNEMREIRDVRTVRIAQSDTLQASEIQGLRAFGSEDQLAMVQAEWARRTSALRDNIALTWENMRLGAIQGVVTDADGSELVDWYDLFGVAKPAEIDFDLDNANPAAGALRKACTGVIRAMQRAAGGAWTPNTMAYGLCGDDFWDALIAHEEVRQTYLNYAAAAELRNPTAWEMFRFGGIMFVNYRGTDDNSTVAVPSAKCKFFPVGASDMFAVAFSPGESFEVVNTLGRPLYNIAVTDRDRNAWVRSELYSYPLFICLRPKVLQSARMT
jgi:hypothetical protein